MAKPTEGGNDFALERVPENARYSWFAVAVQRLGQLSALSSFLLGATLGFGMTFWGAFWAITLGSVILELVCIFTGIMGAREGLNTSVLARWSGFGAAGSAIIGLAISVSLIGWFGIQSGVAADGLNKLIPAGPTWVWSLVFGLGITAIVAGGFKIMQWTANITVPLFLILVTWAIVSELSNHSFGDLLTSAPSGPALTLVQGTTFVAGGFIVGAIITPDQTRYNRTVSDVVKQTVLSVTLGEYGMGLAGVLLAHAVHSADVTAIIMSSVGWVGVLVLVLGTVKINDWNLYSAGLGVVTFVSTVIGKGVHRVWTTIIIGVVGSILATVGILGQFVGFLSTLGVVFPPIAGIFIAEYFIVKKWRGQLDATREKGTMPESSPTWVPATLVIWLIAALVGEFVTIGLPSLNSLLVSFVLYWLASKIGLLRGYGVSSTTIVAPAEEPAAVPIP